MLNNRKLTLEKTPPLYLRVYQILKDSIVNGDFAPGEQIVETKLAEELKVSRTPIRDAIRQLAKDGLVVAQENGTATIFNPTVFDVAEIFVTRAALEAQAGTIVSKIASRHVLNRLTEIMNRAKEAIERGDVNMVVECNTDFHESIIYASQNKKIIQTIEAMNLHIMQVRRTSLKKIQHRSTSLNEHLEIVQTLKTGDAFHINQMISQHILRAGFRMIQDMGIPEVTSPTIDYLLGFSEEKKSN
jgi:DNA-binding GntR family transcriptional regulator